MLKCLEIYSWFRIIYWINGFFSEIFVKQFSESRPLRLKCLKFNSAASESTVDSISHTKHSSKQSQAFNVKWKMIDEWTTSIYIKNSVRRNYEFQIELPTMKQNMHFFTTIRTQSTHQAGNNWKNRRQLYMILDMRIYL